MIWDSVLVHYRYNITVKQFKKCPQVQIVRRNPPCSIFAGNHSAHFERFLRAYQVFLAFPVGQAFP